MTDPVREPARATWVPVVLCTAIAGITASSLVSARDVLPDPVATHWGIDGRPDGFSSFGSTLAFSGLFTLGIALVLVLVGALRGVASVTGPIAVGSAAFVGWLFGATTLAQRGLSDAADAPSSDAAMLPALGLGLLGALVTWLLTRRWGQREVPPSSGLPDDAPRLDLPSGQAIAWTGHTRRSPRALALVVAVCLVPVVTMAGLALTQRLWGTATTLLLPALVGLVAGCCLSATVTVGRSGVRARGLGVVPLVTIPLDDVHHAELVPDTGVMAWGGWGYRTGPDGQRALITASGPALRVERRGGGSVVITVDDAERAVAVVNTLVARRDRTEGAVR